MHTEQPRRLLRALPPDTSYRKLKKKLLQLGQSGHSVSSRFPNSVQSHIAGRIQRKWSTCHYGWREEVSEKRLMNFIQSRRKTMLELWEEQFAGAQPEKHVECMFHKKNLHSSEVLFQLAISSILYAVTKATFTTMWMTAFCIDLYSVLGTGGECETLPISVLQRSCANKDNAKSGSLDGLLLVLGIGTATLESHYSSLRLTVWLEAKLFFLGHLNKLTTS